MAGKVGCVIVRWGSVGYGQAGEASWGGPGALSFALVRQAW